MADSNVSDDSGEFLDVSTGPHWMRICWTSNGKSRRAAIKLRRIGKFSARGMQQLYGRLDCFPWSGRRRTITSSCDMWQARDGRVVARLSFRSQDIYTKSLEIVGVKLGKGPEVGLLGYDEELVPQILRDAYAEWQVDELMEADLM